MMAQRSSLRASDADRDRVAERLRVAATEGRIYAHELEERLAKALRARTYGELDEVVDDLPGAPIPVAVTIPRPGHLELLRRYPVGLAIVGAVLGVVVAATVAAIVAVAASGVWLLPVIAYFVIRARLFGGRSGRRAHHGGHHGRRRRDRFEDPRVHLHARRSWPF